MVTGNNFFGYYKFNSGEGDILYDHSGNQNHGTIVGATWEEIEEETVLGCTDPLATNYDINANSDDGTCSYPDNGNFSLSFDGDDLCRSWKYGFLMNSRCYIYIDFLD